MKNSLRIDQILDFCDLPQVMTARDNYDTLYLCLLYDDTERPVYSAVRISSEMLSSLKEGKYDLRHIFANPEVKGEFFNVEIRDGELFMQKMNVDKLPEERLPLEGYFLDGYKSDKITVSVPQSDRNLFESIIRRFGWIAM